MNPTHGFKFPEVIDSTSRKSFASCEQKWFFESVECIQPPSHSVHLTAGGAFAKGLEVLRTEYYLRKRTVEEALESARLAILLEWGDFEPMFSWSENQREAKTLDALFDALDFYITQWPLETDLVQPLIRGESISVEFSFGVPIPGTRHPVTGNPIIYAGRFDMLGVYDGVLYVVDEKTTKQLGPSWSDQWETRSQFTGYCWAARQYGFPVGGAIVRGISFLKGGFGSAQTITYRDDWRIQQWLLQLQENVNRMIQVWETASPNLNLDDACNSFAGCPYQKLCFSPDPSAWKGEYVARTWNPLHVTT